MTTVKITTVGDSTGIILPAEVLERLRVGNGDELRLLDTPNGFELTPCEPSFDSQVAAAELVMRSDAEVLRKLAE
ncbi:MAG TPA: hypothetical protein VHU84_10535 [Lacipirellulaceae bacterium]|jgi:putative addiction module antidote|nr:hypothetical protein [Lacipirellulaceae bacterium]